MGFVRYWVDVLQVIYLCMHLHGFYDVREYYLELKILGYMCNHVGISEVLLATEGK